MHHTVRNLLTLLFLPLFAAALGAAESPAEPYKPGDVFETIAVKDQHEKDARISPGSGTKHLIVSFSMSTGKDANRYFENKGATWLDENEAVFLANIYGMPGIGRVFAMPKMKKYPHRILLGDDEHLLDRYPEQKGKLTVFDFNPDGTITAIRFLDPEKDLDKLFP